jgi:lipoprotein-releasing system permease protein
MNTSWFIARRLAVNEKRSFSRFIIRLAISAVALSTAVMIIGSSITRGYQEVIRQKFYSCWGQIHITNFLTDPNDLNSYETFASDSTLIDNIQSLKGVETVETYTIQSGILKTKDELEGLLLKGINTRSSAHPIESYLVSGSGISVNDTTYSTDVLLSKTVATLLKLNAGDQAILYFMMNDQASPKARKVRVAGIYNTGLEDFDKLFAICDSRMINHICGRDEQQINGYEVYTKKGFDQKKIESDIFNRYTHEPLHTYLLEHRFENVFSWLGMMKMNERIIILIMLLIAIINMITALLILVMERTTMIGVLKSMGMLHRDIRRVFIYSSLFILLIGLSLGTTIGVMLCFLQQRFGFLKLDESTYYVKTVPIYLDPIIILGINLIALIICTLLLIVPSVIVNTISPTKALKFT